MLEMGEGLSLGAVVGLGPKEGDATFFPASLMMGGCPNVVALYAVSASNEMGISSVVSCCEQGGTREV